MRLDERTVVSQIDRLTLRELRLWVREGWVRPAEGAPGPYFDEVDLARVQLLCDLRKDLSLPEDSMPTILALIDRLHQTRRELRWLAEALEDQSEEVRLSVVGSFNRRRRESELDDEI